MYISKLLLKLIEKKTVIIDSDTTGNYIIKKYIKK